MEYIKNIVFYLIMSTILINALPSNSFKKYAKFITGLILSILLMSPILKITGADEKMLTNFYLEQIEQNVNSLQNEAHVYTDEETKNMVMVYKNNIAQTIESIAADKGFASCEATVTVNEETYNIDSIDVVLNKDTDIGVANIIIADSEYKEDDAMVSSLRNEIIYFYNIDEKNINIIVQE